MPRETHGSRGIDADHARSAVLMTRAMNSTAVSILILRNGEQLLENLRTKNNTKQATTPCMVAMFPEDSTHIRTMQDDLYYI